MSDSSSDAGDEQNLLLKKASFPDVEKEASVSTLAPKVLSAMQKRINKLYEHETKLKELDNKNVMQSKFLILMLFSFSTCAIYFFRILSSFIGPLKNPQGCWRRWRNIPRRWLPSKNRSIRNTVLVLSMASTNRSFAGNLYLIVYRSLVGNIFESLGDQFKRTKLEHSGTRRICVLI